MVSVATIFGHMQLKSLKSSNLFFSQKKNRLSCKHYPANTANVKNFRQEHESIASRNKIKLNYDVQEKNLQGQSSSKREFTGGLI
jgi:hypothetical protein